jgi:double-strand break repair protein MRE11
MNCFGDKPCELEMLSDASENFQGAFNHVNYEDLGSNTGLIWMLSDSGVRP